MSSEDKREIQKMVMRSMEHGICPIVSSTVNELRNFGDSAVNKGYSAYFLLRMRETAVFPLSV